MAEKRMFSMKIIDSDSFLDLPTSSQCLYFHLCMRADDEGFLNNANKIMKIIGANQNDYDLLKAKAFIIEFPDGICVIKHWRINNYIRGDRFHPTSYVDEREMLSVKSNGAYTLMHVNDFGIPDGNQLTTENSIDKNRIDKSSVDNARAHARVNKEWFDKTWEKYPKKWTEAMAFTAWWQKFENIIEGNEKDFALEIYRATMLYLDRYKINNIGDPDLKFVRSYDEWLKDECDYWIGQYNAIKKRMSEEDDRG